MDVDFEFDDDRAKSFADFLKSKSEQLEKIHLFILIDLETM